jgi:hypothetical protein
VIPAFVEANVLAWLAQMLFLGTLGALLPLLFRLRHPQSLVVYAHLVLLICLAFPFVQPRHAVPRRLTEAVATVNTVRPYAVGSSVEESRPQSFGSAGAVFWTLAAGLLVRSMWLGAGLWRLRRYRKSSLALGGVGSGACQPERVAADFRISRELESPATFGLFRPVVLLPESFLTIEAGAQAAIACHELIHVRRRDWLATVAEELALAVLWFHPGLWWLVGRARLAREEIVDAEVVRRTSDRDSYVQALLEMAGQRRPRRPPASMFADGRDLKWRVRALLSEVSMSKSRLLVSYAAMAVLVGLAGWTAMTAFPLQAEPVLQEPTEPGDPELDNVNNTLVELNALLEEVTGIQAAEEIRVEEIRVQEAPEAPGGRGQRGGVAGVRVAPIVTQLEIILTEGGQEPVEESSPGVVRLQAAAGGVNGLRVRRRAFADGAAPEAPEVIEGEVTVLLTFNGDGQIVDSRVSSGPDPLRHQALQTALQQNYGEQYARVLQVIVEFVTPPPPPPSGAGGRGAPGGARGGGPAPQ